MQEQKYTHFRCENCGTITVKNVTLEVPEDGVEFAWICNQCKATNKTKLQSVG